MTPQELERKLRPVTREMTVAAVRAKLEEQTGSFQHPDYWARPDTGPAAARGSFER